jgi:hypothetical protein
MTTYPKSPKEMTRGMMYFPRMLDKIRLHAQAELREDYHNNSARPEQLMVFAAIFCASIIAISATARSKVALMKRSSRGALKKGGV